jgi:uncharacterized protein YbaA (DUF1428 family)
MIGTNDDNKCALFLFSRLGNSTFGNTKGANMPFYVDGFVLPVPRDRVDDYKRIAEAAAEIWKEHGALDYWECVGDDMTAECTRSFPDLVAATPDEIVVFAWAVFASREARDAANEKIMADPRMANLIDPSNPIFDMKRVTHGGFRALVRSSNWGPNAG